MQDYQELVLLIAEDDDGHAELIKSGLYKTGLKNKIIRFEDGEKLFEFLSGNYYEELFDIEKSYLLLLDINMPIMDGIEVLKLIKTNENLKDIPVIILTTTDDPREVAKCYKLGCSAYINKPIDFLEFSESLKSLGHFIQTIKVQQYHN